MSAEEIIQQTLGHKTPDRAQEVVEALEGAGWLVEPGTPVNAVEVLGARVQVERVEVYGLHIGVDANGNAVTVEFPYGAEVTERRA